MIYSFDKPHKIGSVCGVRCTQCGYSTRMTDENGRRIPPQPLFILREASPEEFRAEILVAIGSFTEQDELNLQDCYFYEVSSD